MSADILFLDGPTSRRMSLADIKAGIVLLTRDRRKVTITAVKPSDFGKSVIGTFEDGTTAAWCRAGHFWLNGQIDEWDLVAVSLTETAVRSEPASGDAVEATPAPDLPQATHDHTRQELAAIALHMAAASEHFGMLAAGTIGSIDFLKGTNDLEAALFYALTLKGCLQGDRPLRQALLSRMEEREIGDHG